MPGTGGFFGAILKVLLDDAQKAFGHGILGRALQNMTKGSGSGQKTPPLPPLPPPTNVHEAAQQALHASIGGFGAGGGKQSFPNPLPVLHQILEVLHVIASHLHIQTRLTPGAPSSPEIRERVRDMVERGQWKNIARPGTAGHIDLSGIPGGSSPPPGAPPVPEGINGVLLGFGKVAGIVGIVVGGLGLAANALKNFVTGVLDSNRQLYRYNAALAGSFAKLDIAMMQLDIQQAGAVAPAAGELNDAIGELAKEFQPMRQGIGVISNKLSTLVVNSTRGVVWALKNQHILNGIAAIFPLLGAILPFVKKFLDDEEKKNKALGGALTDDLRALQNPGPPGGMAGGKIVPPKQPAFLPPLIRPGGR